MKPADFNHRRPTTAGTYAATLVLLLGVSVSRAQEVPTGTLNLSRTPLFLNQAVDPNILVTLDDSGSMARAFMPDGQSASCGYRHPRFYWSGFNRVYYNPDVTYVPPLQPDATPFPNATFTAAWIDGFEAATSIVADAGGSATVNLSNRYFPTVEQNARSGNDHTNRVGHDYRARGTTTCGGANGGADNSDAALPFGPDSEDSSDRGTDVDSAAFYYRFTGTDPTSTAQINNRANYVAVNVANQTAAEQQNFANWYSYYRTRSMLARTAASRAFAVLDRNIRVAWQNFNNNQLATASEIRPLAASWRSDFFNWLYRSVAVCDSISCPGTPLRRSTQRAGIFFERSSLNFRNPYFEPATATAPARELSCRQNFHVLLTDGFWNGSNPSRTYEDDASAVTFPDGREYSSSIPEASVYWNEATPASVPTLADITFDFWRRDLRPTLDNNVPAFYPDLTTGVTGPYVPPATIVDPSQNDEIYFNPANNPATWQHMVTFIVGLGVAGNLRYPDDFPDLRTGDLAWPGVTSNTARTMDDTWHAAVNSRGEYFSASDPTELVTSLTRLFSSVQQRRASITPVSVSSPLQALGSKAFRTGFDTSDWSGTVVGLDFVPDDPATATNEESFNVRWRAEELLDARDPATRRILTSANAAGSSVVDFQWASLSNEQRTELRRDPATGVLDTVATGQARLAYIRGVRSAELQNGGDFRNRSTVLGAVVNSGTAVVGRASENYVDVPSGLDPGLASTDRFSFPIGSPERNDANGYAGFRTSTAGRREMIYVGANDGMLHAFDQDTGEEVWAYVPYAVHRNLARLTSPLDLDYQSYVDATPDVRDAYRPGVGWRTILVATLRLGGQGAFAIDVTDPDSPQVLWEYSDVSTGGEDLGFTYGLPFLTRLHTGQWVVLLPGGYNSEVIDGNSGSRQAVLYVMELFSGTVIRKFQLGAGTIGLGSVVGGDYDLECDPNLENFCKVTGRNVLDVTDQAFAGDLTGNLWRFDLRDSTPSDWSVELFFRAEGPTGLRQPITARPWIPSTTDGRAVILVGTGKYIEPGDRTRLIPGQSMYGLFDQGASPASGDYPLGARSRLLEQDLTAFGGDINRRTLSVNLIDPAVHRGWYFDLPDPGERIIVQTAVRGGEGIGIVPSLIPLSEDPCKPNAESFLLFFDVSNGGIPGSSRGAVDADGDGIPDFTVSFDTNGDRVINAADDARQIGRRVASFIAAVTPVTVPGGGEGRIILPGLDGDVTSVDSLVVPEYEWRRRTWRELFRE